MGVDRINILSAWGRRPRLVAILEELQGIFGRVMSVPISQIPSDYGSGSYAFAKRAIHLSELRAVSKTTFQKR